MKQYKLFSIIMMLMLGMSFVSCSSDDDENEDVIVNENDGGNEGSRSSYDYSQMIGYCTF